MYSIKLMTCMTLFISSAVAVEPGDLPPRDVRDRVRSLGSELEGHMVRRDHEAVASTVQLIRTALGPYAGVPDAANNYIEPPDTAARDVRQLQDDWVALYERHYQNEGARGEWAAQNKLELRYAAYVALACFAMVESDVPDAAGFLEHGNEELDYLLSRQLDTGAFPYPIDPQGNAPPNMREWAERARTDGSREIHGDYFGGHGGGQFDTGCCSYALSEGYRLTGDVRYLDAARRAGDWALQLGFSSNWNYNAFSVWQLAKLYSVTNEAKYLEGAVERALIGVLPGLMETGRWVDQHNAKQSYHWIMLRALAELVSVLPESNPHYDYIRERVVLAADTRARETVDRGACNIESSLWGMAAVLRLVEPKPLWEDAANIVVNATYKLERLNGAALPHFIRYLMEKETGDYSPEALVHRGGRIERALSASGDRDLRGLFEDARQAYEAGYYRQAGAILTRLEARMTAQTDAAARTQPLQTLTPAQSGELRKITARLGKAMADKDKPAIGQAVDDAVGLLGEQAGLPEAGLTYRDEFDDSPRHSLEEAREWLEKQMRAAIERDDSPFSRVALREMPLRVYAEQMFNLAALHATAEGEARERLETLIRAGADALVGVQASNGVFGFPYDPDSTERLRQMGARIVARGEAQGLTMVENGWIIEDIGDGGLQFDNGLAGTAVVMAHDILGDARYARSVTRCVEYVKRIPAVTNWNYNAFSARFLAAAYADSPDNEILDTLSEKLALGVLPGIMKSGRYFDAHNARAVYHLIVVEALLDALDAMQAGHRLYEEAAEAAKRMILNSADEILEWGPHLNNRCLGAFSRYLLRFGHDDRVDRALNIIVNDSRTEGPGGTMVSVGAHYLKWYIEYLKRQDMASALPAGAAE